ncbi:sarcosine oxidase subunit alpha family protein [Ensifer adhaerens]|uniref:sarcosine oxidase subunit alpha family protein n=1 Tax=Ensifer adhaerens TaxID=106592 RepID=UPI001CBDDFB5|nr:sarcosine oxidase subunit alpha family protein [Ensifer adhaerens]MBZ7924281.1 sarcosine oxidase subunit alpha family protein [Ensifer adhaerens]UAX96468.1 sarcosine oxidase subunit alpha family protein [Ensifer adhaerens]UAY04189.1 sarcosine oxidase subunit alpha family protein [Ensifer adhaerens]UAY12175.1 sarcosine oxidase subunit alpha family protein [Ensifer adhaerens]
MTSNKKRLPSGGHLDRSQVLKFTFDGEVFSGYKGDTLASALLANGVTLVGRSFKYHRPRGFLSAGAEEPNALLTIGSGARREPNIPATTAELSSGLEAFSQNNWPSLRFDLQSINGLFSPILSSGFYYKTFMGPTRKAWMFYEHFIRKAAGLGRGTIEVDPDSYSARDDFTEVAVVGAGPAGLAAATAAAQAGARVVLIEQDFELGGQLLSEPGATTWLDAVRTNLLTMPNVCVMNRTVAFGHYDGNSLALLEEADPVATKPGDARKIFTLLRAEKIVFATGAIERPMVFSNNDRPGVMLNSAIRTYLNRFAILPGRNVVISTVDDNAYALAYELASKGVRVTVADTRPSLNPVLLDRVRNAGAEVHLETHIRNVTGGLATRSVQFSGKSGTTSIDCDVVGMSGGWSPVLHLTSHQGVKPTYRSEIDAFVPGQLPEGQFVAGAITGSVATTQAVMEGLRAGRSAAAAVGYHREIADLAAPDIADSTGPGAVHKPAFGQRKAFIDFQMDVTLDDIQLAQREGYEAIEHLKRYTTLGMGTDQGKTSNISALKAMAELRGTTVPATGTTTFRPPYTPVAIGALAGRAIGVHFRPVRRTPMHDWHIANGAEMVEVGLWMRPWFFREFGDDVNAAYVNEMRLVRTEAGLMDISTLGKIDVQGPDAATFLDRVYANGFASLKLGRARYGVMLRDDGIVFDDGTTTRVGQDRYFMTTSTAKAADVLSWLEFLLDSAWSDLRVSVSSITDEWAGMSIAGPNAHAILTEAFHGLDVSGEALPHMAMTEGTFQGSALRILRLSYSGERAYEIYVGASKGAAAWEHILDIGSRRGLKPYGVEALGALRIEKGHVAGPEIDGRTTLADLGMGRMVAKRTGYVGEALSRREAFQTANRQRVVGLQCIDTGKRLRGGALLFAPGDPLTGHGRGRVTSTTFSPELGCSIGLGLLAADVAGEDIIASYPMKNEIVRAKIVSPIFLDPAGERMHA